MANRIDGQVTAIDSFGNLVTNITREMLAGVPTDESVGVVCDEHETRGIFTAYADQPPMTLIALVGSTDMPRARHRRRQRRDHARRQRRRAGRGAVVNRRSLSVGP